MFNGLEIDYQEIIVKNDGFWPDINIADFQKSRSITAAISADLIRDALLTAISEVNISLERFKTKHIAKGIYAVNGINGISSDGINSVMALYKKAIYSRAKADLIGEFVAISNVKQKIDANQNEMESKLLAEGTRAIRAILGYRRSSVELI
jgi:hypothetical protein